MADGAEVGADKVVRSTEVDQVEAARDWLRRHGAEPVDRPESEGDLRLWARDEGSGETGYSRSRRAPSAGSSGRSFSATRRRGRSSDGADEVDPDGVDTVRTGSSGLEEDPEELARGIVLRKLAVQARTRVELERALAGRDVPEEAAAVVLDRMTEVGLVDDVTFAHDWVASRQQRRSLSRTALRRELQTKGVDREVIDDALADVEGDDEHRAALDLARRRAAAMGGLPRDVAYRRLGGVLARRGFSSSITTRVLSEVLEGFPRDV